MVALVMANDEVSVSIVRPLPIDVMNYGPWRKKMAKRLFCNQDMLLHVSALTRPHMGWISFLHIAIP